MQGVSAFDEFPHSVWQDALPPLLRGRGIITGWIGQLIHADDAVLMRTQGFCVEHKKKCLFIYFGGGYNESKTLC